MAKKLGEILIEMRYVSQDEVAAALAQQKGGDSRKIGDLLVELKACDEEQIAKGLARQGGLKYCQISKFNIPPEVVALVPVEVAKERTLFPLKRGKRALTVAIETKLEFYDLEDLRIMLGV